MEASPEDNKSHENGVNNKSDEDGILPYQNESEDLDKSLSQKLLSNASGEEQKIDSGDEEYHNFGIGTQDEGIGPNTGEDWNDVNEMTRKAYEQHEYLQLLLDDVEALENAIKQRSEKDDLVEEQEALKKKLDQIGTEVEEQPEEHEISDIHDQINILKFEETMYNNKLKKLNTNLEDVLNAEVDPKVPKEKITDVAIEEALSARFKTEQNKRYKEQIEQLDKLVKLKEQEVNFLVTL